MVHRTTSDSKLGRSMIHHAVPSDPRKISPEVRKHNAEVERKKQEKKMRKLQSKK